MEYWLAFEILSGVAPCYGIYGINEDFYVKDYMTELQKHGYIEHCKTEKDEVGWRRTKKGEYMVHSYPGKDWGDIADYAVLEKRFNLDWDKCNSSEEKCETKEFCKCCKMSFKKKYDMLNDIRNFAEKIGGKIVIVKGDTIE